MENIRLVYHSIYVRYDYINQKEAPFKQLGGNGVSDPEALGAPMRSAVPRQICL